MHYRFVDCRWELGDPARGRELYRSFHIPGASFLDVDEDLSEVSVTGEGRHPLPSAERFAAAASRAGIGNDTWVVAYGSGGGAERLWWLLRHFGHDACAVLLGGIDAWGGPYASGDEAVEPAEFVPRERADDTIGADELAARLGVGSTEPPRSGGAGFAGAGAGTGDPALVLVDARIPSRWRGEPNPIDNPPGRIPGALNAPWTEPLADLPDGELVAYCGSGVTACVVLHRLHLRGRGGRLYPGSWSDWSARGLPLERD